MKKILFALTAFFISSHALAHDSLIFVSSGRVEVTADGDLPLLATIRSRCATVANNSDCIKPIRISKIALNSHLLQSVGVHNPQAPSFAMLSSIDQIEVLELKDGMCSFGPSDLLVLYRAGDELHIYGIISPETSSGQSETYQVQISLKGQTNTLAERGVIYIK